MHFPVEEAATDLLCRDRRIREICSYDPVNADCSIEAVKQHKQCSPLRHMPSSQLTPRALPDVCYSSFTVSAVFLPPLCLSAGSIAQLPRLSAEC